MLVPILLIKKNEKVFEQLQEEYFELEEVENDRRKENLYAYGYILDKERSNPYTSYDFEKQMIVTTKTNEISSENYIRIGFESTNCDNARMIAEAYEKLLTEVVKEQVGDFEYEIEGESVSRRLPTASQGANASRTKTNSVSVAGSGVSLNYVVKQVAKGVVWGSLLGFFFALIIVALWYFLSGKIQRISEAEKFEIEFLGTYTGNQKKKIHNLIVKISNWVEGEKRLFKTSNEIVEILSGRCNLENLEESILVSGTGNLENINSFAKDLDEKTKGQVCAMPYVLSSKETIDACKWIKRVILVEELGFASKKEIKSEIEFYKALEIEVLGIVVMQ